MLIKLLNLLTVTVLIIAGCTGIVLDTFAAENDDPVSGFDRVLGRYVTNDGLVDYEGLKKDKEFFEFIKYLSDTDPDSLATDKDRLAFWINAYNAFVLFGVVEEYPIKSVLKVGKIPHSFFIFKTFKTKQGKITLRKLENKKIREAFGDERIHFAINCASAGCPKLISKAYRAESLDQQLDERAKAFINNRNKNYLDREKSILYLSRIFKWYEGDFTKDYGTLENYIAKYINKEDAEFIKTNKVKIEYLEYGWDLNNINK
ncbi:MAG: DUF547 domain-containing protein [Candidatus Anammoxibacter sp.]